MASYMMNEQLNRFFADEVQLTRDTSKCVVAKVLPKIHEILQAVHEKDVHYKQNATSVGSYYQGLKVEKADEFDFSIPFHIGTKLTWVPAGKQQHFGFNDPSQNDEATTRQDLRVVPASTALQNPGPGYISVTLTDSVHRSSQNLQEFMFQEYVIPFLVKMKFRALLFSVLNNNGRSRDDITMSRKLHGPALTMTTDVKDGRETIPVDIDFAVVIEAGLPFTDSTGWPRPGALWPSRDKVTMIKDKGINVVAKKNFYWLLSFAELEKTLIWDVDKDSGCRKKVHRIMKTLFHQSKVKDKNKLSSYMLKNAWLWECEANPNSESWMQNRLSERFIGCIRRLLAFTDKGSLPQYFYPAIDLFKGKDIQQLKRIVTEIYSQYTMGTNCYTLA